MGRAVNFGLSIGGLSGSAEPQTESETWHCPRCCILMPPPGRALPARVRSCRSMVG